MVYRYRVTIEDNKVFMREYLFKSATKLYSCHLFLVNDLGFSPDQMALFRVYEEEGEKPKEYALFDLGDGTMDQISLEALYSKGVLQLEYVYDMFKGRSLKLDFLSKEEIKRKHSYPQLVAERGKNPGQFSDNYDDFEQMLDVDSSDDLLDPISEEDE